MEFARAVIGLLVLIAFAYLFSADRRKIDWRLVLTGVTLQIVFGLLITQVEFVKLGFNWVSAQFVTLLGFSRLVGRFQHQSHGTNLVFLSLFLSLMCSLFRHSNGLPYIFH